MQSLYLSHPIGSLLVRVTPTQAVNTWGDQELPPGFVNLLLDRKTRYVAIFGPVPIFDRRPQQLRLPTIRWLGVLSDRNRVVDSRGR